MWRVYVWLVDIDHDNLFIVHYKCLTMLLASHFIDMFAYNLINLLGSGRVWYYGCLDNHCYLMLVYH